MSASHLYILAKTSKSIVILAVATSFIIIFGGFGVYLVEHKQPSANITTLGDAIWWAVVTLATVGYGDYYPVTPLGRIIAIFMMLSGIGVFALLVSNLAQRRLLRRESRLKLKSEDQANLLGQESKTVIKNKIDGIENLTEEDFDTLIINMKSLRRSLLEESKIKCSRCNISNYTKHKFCSNCGLNLSGV
jgi:NADH pyrophosphatase NudC (nudix superfamily)